MARNEARSLMLAGGQVVRPLHDMSGAAWVRPAPNAGPVGGQRVAQHVRLLAQSRSRLEMARSAPLTPRQRDVLHWIGDGCPAGVMQGFTHKASAVALQDRRLVSI